MHLAKLRDNLARCAEQTHVEMDLHLNRNTVDYLTRRRLLSCKYKSNQNQEIKLIQYRNKHAKNPLDELKKGLGNGTIDKTRYFDVQNQLTLHKEKMEADGKFFNADGYAINVPESVPEETDLDETEITETEVSTVETVKETQKAKS